MDLRVYIEGRRGAFLRALYGSYDAWPSWKRLMAEMPETECARVMFFENVCADVWRKVKFEKYKFDNKSIDAEDDLDQFGAILNFMYERASLFGDKTAQEIEEVPQAWEDRTRFFALERVARKGWTREIEAFYAGIGSGVETVDIHSVKTAILAGLMGDNSFERLFLMGLVHDHAEQWIGDLTPSEVDDRAAKKRKELNIYREKIEESGLFETKKKLFLHAFEMCMDDMSAESCLIHIADKLDMAMQAWVYERRFGVDLREFFDSAGRDIEQSVNRMMTLKSICDIR